MELASYAVLSYAHASRTPMFCPLLTSAGTAARLSPTRPSQLARGADIARAADLNWPVCSPGTPTTHVEVLFPRTWPNMAHWWEVENNCFLHLCFHVDFACFFSFSFNSSFLFYYYYYFLIIFSFPYSFFEEGEGDSSCGGIYLPIRVKWPHKHTETYTY